MQPDSADLLHDILDAAGFIAEDTVGYSLDSFTQDRRRRQAVERNFEIIGEAMNRLTRHDPELVSRISGYAEIIAFRNVLIHGYAVISYQRVWEHVQVHLPVLRQEVEALLDELET